MVTCLNLPVGVTGLKLIKQINKKGDYKMVELKGTEKQVKWAKDIRNLSIAILNEKINKNTEVNKLFLEKKGRNNKITLLKIEEIKKTIDKIKLIDNSSWFINNLRYSNIQSEEIIEKVENYN